MHPDIQVAAPFVKLLMLLTVEIIFAASHPTDLVDTSSS
jgi:hypothetical protein